MNATTKSLTQVLHALPCHWLLLDCDTDELKMVECSEDLKHPKSIWKKLQLQQNPFENCKNNHPEAYMALLAGVANTEGGTLISLPMESTTGTRWPLLFVERIPLNTSHPTALVVFTDSQNQEALYGYQDALNYTSQTVLKLNQLLHLHTHTLPTTYGKYFPFQKTDMTLDILFIEDTPINQKITKRYLEQYGHNVTVADNGKDGLSKLVGHTYDVILTDVDMPEMDGYETTKAIRQYEKDNNLPETPIIAVTARDLLESGKALKQAGANAFIPKPIDQTLLIEILKSLNETHIRSEFCSYVFNTTTA